MFNNLLTLVLTTLLTWQAQACPRQGGEFSVLPAHGTTRDYPVTAPGMDPDGFGEMSEELFDEVMDLIEEIYQPYLSLAGIDFSVKRDYASSYQNAHPGREGTHWFIEMYGGYFRDRDYETFETLAVVACHEVGHHLGETAYYTGSWSWASAEGQSDYFSSLKCLRKVFQDSDNQAWIDNYPSEIPEYVTEQCESVWQEQEQINLCIRSSVASYQWALFEGSYAIQFDTPDTSVVGSTYVYHNASQCRLDTLFQGALCTVDDSIPHSAGDDSAGNCTSQTHEVGLRPSCWYKEI